MQPAGIFVFLLTYILVSARRLEWIGLDRPAGAMVGAVLTVGLGVLSPAQALAAVDLGTLLLLFGVMGMGSFLLGTVPDPSAPLTSTAESGRPQMPAAVASFVRTPERLLGAIVWGSGLASALITNDAVCILAAPFVVRLVGRYRLSPLPFLLALATAANTGSVATLVGNPQNMLCASLGGLHYAAYAATMLPVALIGLAINHALLWWFFRDELRQSMPEGVLAAAHPTNASPAMPRSGTRGGWTLAVIFATPLAFTFGADMAWTATAGFTLLLLIHRPRPGCLWTRIDWGVLLFFAALFVVTAGLVASGAPEAFFQRYPLAGNAQEPRSMVWLAGVFLIGSNLVSNVPFILVARDQMAGLSDPELGWTLLAMTSTFAGNLTLLGSVANIIVAEAGRTVGGIGFFEYLRVGLPISLLTTAAGVGWLMV